MIATSEWCYCSYSYWARKLEGIHRSTARNADCNIPLRFRVMTWTSTQQRHERMMNGQYSQGFHKKKS